MTKKEFEEALYSRAVFALDMADNTEESKKQVSKEIKSDAYGASFNIALTNNLLIVGSDEPKLMFHCDLDEASIRLCDNEKKAYLYVGTKTFRITLFFSPVETPHYNVVHLGSRRP